MIKKNVPLDDMYVGSQLLVISDAIHEMLHRAEKSSDMSDELHDAVVENVLSEPRLRPGDVIRVVAIDAPFVRCVRLGDEDPGRVHTIHVRQYSFRRASRAFIRSFSPRSRAAGRHAGAAGPSDGDRAKRSRPGEPPFGSFAA